MKYIKIMRSEKSKPCEITKSEARKTLDGYWKTEALNDIFDNEKMFRLYTPFSVVETQSKDGLVPAAGFYGVCD